MKHIRFFILTISLFVVALATAQTRGVADNAIPGDNKLRYYRLAIAIAQNSYTTDFGRNYENVKNFWQECEDFMNEVYVPLGMCFDVVVDEELLLGTDLPISNNGLPEISGVTDLINTAIGSGSYDIGICITHRDLSEGNTGLSAVNGAYTSTAKANSYAMADKWVVAHEVGHLFGADHTTEGEGSLMDNIGEFFSYPSIKKIRDASVSNGPVNVFKYETVANEAPAFTAQMKETYRIPKGACLSIPVYASDANGHSLRYAAIGCSSSTVGSITGNSETKPHFASLKPQTNNVIDYRPEYTADGDSYYLPVDGTNIPSKEAGSYSIAILVNDMPEGNSYDYLNSNPFYSNYSVWDATVQIVGGTAFNASIRSAKNSYSAGESVTVDWGVNNSYFGTQMLRITMSADYGETFPYVLAESVPATNGTCTVTLPNVNVGNVDVDFVTKTRSMRAGIIRVEEIGGVAYTLTTLSPENGGGFTVTGGSDAPDPVVPTQYTVSVQAEPAVGGTATVNDKESVTVDAGSSVLLKATANSGYKFDGWYLNSTQVSTSSTYSLSANGNATYTAKFSAVATPEPEPGQQATNTVSVKAEPAEGGTATVDGNESAIVQYEGYIVILEATANDGYNFDGWYLK